ncbi:MAG: hypothetical protein ACFE7E_01170 [Candidatus Hodarchaeota archaeon]
MTRPVPLRDTPATLRIAGAALFAALSTLLQFVPIYVTPWGMAIDLVAVPWVICFFVFGFESALVCSLICLPTVGLVGGGGFVGAIMKFAASVWMFVVPTALVLRIREGRYAIIKRTLVFVLVSIGAIVVRNLVTVLFNFYFAIPVFFGISIEEGAGWVVGVSEAFLTGLFGELDLLLTFALIIAFWNTLQGAIDLGVSWVCARVWFAVSAGPPPISKETQSLDPSSSSKFLIQDIKLQNSGSIGS